MMRSFGRLACAAVCGLSVSSTVLGATVAPILADYGNVFPTLLEQNLDVSRTADPAPWYVSFNLLADADVRLGAQSLPTGFFNPGFLDLTAIRLVTIDGANVAFGTDTFSTNPFPSPIEHLVVANGLSAGAYALEVSGSGDRSGADFTVRIQVIPEPEVYALMVAGLGLVAWAVRKPRGGKAQLNWT